MIYCDPDKVMRRLPNFVKDWKDDDNTLPRATVIEAITEATSVVRTIVGMKFDILAIELLSPLPPSIVYMTEIKSAMLITDWFGPMDMGVSKEMHEDLKNHFMMYRFQILGGMLLDANGEQIDPKDVRVANLKTNELISEIDKIYDEDGWSIYDSED